MSRRLPSTPPTLPGFTFVRVLGSGGFADVFLYEQNMPRRLVAVKVLLSEVVNDDLRQMFQAEANLMAQLSSHPSILTVFTAGVAADGRPYLVMEYCSSSLGQRYRATRLPVAEVLSVGVRIASAVETAHREGVLHRDIKPSNILTTAYGHPVLSDFGIAATLGEASTTDAVGLSIPWSAPEVLHDEVSGTIASEVWSLGATVYSLLAGRSPFEVPGGDNGSTALMTRIRRAKFPPVARPDVPASLEAVLTRAMSRYPEDRQGSALEFVRDLQAVEEELGLPQTPIEVAMDDWAVAASADLDDRTVIGAVQTVDAGRRSRRRRPAPELRTASAPTTTSRDEGSAPTESSAGRRDAVRSRRLVWASVAGGAALVGLAAAAVVAFLGASSGIPVVTDVRAVVGEGSVTFDWNDPGLAAGDAYIVRIDGDRQSPQRDTVYPASAEPGERVCAAVTVVRDGRVGSWSAERCAEAGGEP